MTNTETSILLLSHGQIKQKIKRMAHEILEANFGEKELIFAGICEQGELIAQRLANNLEEISTIKTTVTRIDLDKSHPFREAGDSFDDEINIEDRVIIMVDDVLLYNFTG